MKKLMLALALLASTPALADEGYTVHSNCYNGTHTAGCRTTVAPLPEPMTLTAEEAAEQEAEIVKWEEYCKPTKRQDELGVYRYEYAHKGCDLGKSSD